MKVFIKNMVCARCCFAVESILHKISLSYVGVNLGEIDFGELYGDNLATDSEHLLADELTALGFSILGNKKSKLIEEIKIACLTYLEQVEAPDKKVLSDHISRTITLEYNYLSHLFSVVEGITIEQYFIRLRVEKVKEILLYGEQTVKEIAFQLGFSSVAHLSGQFKRVTGLTPSYFRSLKDQKLRVYLDNL
ncbi:MAG: helix-turn-helix domain-containing protein [Thalassotalea sp.]